MDWPTRESYIQQLWREGYVEPKKAIAQRLRRKHEKSNNKYSRAYIRTVGEDYINKRGDFQARMAARGVKI